jgi:voltage-gated potassium channel
MLKLPESAEAILNSRDEFGAAPEATEPACRPDVSSLDRALAAPMFGLTLLYMGIAGVAVHLMSDDAARYGGLVLACGWILGFLTPLFAGEVLLRWKAGETLTARDFAVCVFPFLRLGAVDHVQGTHLWLPGLGWRSTGRESAEELERRLGYPMIALALLILPLLAVQHFGAALIAHSPALGLAMELAGSLIWMAFAAEFLLMISLSPHKLKYAKSHWLDLAIICLPVISFLRSVRLMRLARLNQLGRTARVFRLRGLGMRAWRAVLLLRIVDRFLNRNPAKRLQTLREQIAEKERELSDLTAELRRVERLALTAAPSRAA